MQITVFGASGKVGRLVVDKLRKDGHNVTVFVHSSSVFEASDNLKIVKGDVHDAGLVQSAVEGADAVISALGSWHTPTKDILSSAMQAIIPAMQEQGSKRLVSLTGSGANAPNEQLGGFAKLSHSLFSLFAGKIIRDAEEHLQLLEQSNLDWTVLRAPIMNNTESDTYILSDKMPSAIETIPRQAVAKALVDQLTSSDYQRQAPHIHKN